MCVDPAQLEDTQVMTRSPVKQTHAARADELRVKIAKAHAEVDTVQSQINRLQVQSQSTIEKPHECATADPEPLKDEVYIPEDHSEVPLDEQIMVRARETVARYKQSVTRYNDLKDAAMGLLGLIAEKEGRTLKDVLEERGIEDDD